MGLSSKRRSGGNPIRAKSTNRVKEKRYEEIRDRKHRLQRNSRPNSENLKDTALKRRRFLDPTTLTQGMTSRCLGAKLPLTSLCGEEIERDLRHMEAYANACTAYAQQFFIYHNRASVQSGHYGPVTAPTLVSTEHHINGESYDPFCRAMPVRIDPEEDKRVSLLRKRIAISESRREVLETEYMSLRAHYVYESHQLCNARHAVDGQIKILQDLVKSRGKVIALRRVRCAVARDISKVLEHRNVVLSKGKAFVQKDGAHVSDVLKIWNEIEAKLFKAEEACRSITIPRALSLINSSKGKKKREKKQVANGDAEKIVPWGCRKMPGTPEEVPALLSQMSSNPERTAAWSCGSIFGSNETSMCWLTSSLPEEFDKMEQEHENLLHLRKETKYLENELNKVRTANKDLQHHIIGKRLRNDEMCAMMALLRSETEAVLDRHNVLLETKEARAAAQDIHDRSLEEHDRCSHMLDDIGDERESSESAKLHLLNREENHNISCREEHGNDGDDEGEMDDDEEETEGNEELPKDVVITKNEDRI